MCICRGDSGVVWGGVRRRPERHQAVEKRKEGCGVIQTGWNPSLATWLCDLRQSLSLSEGAGPRTRRPGYQGLGRTGNLVPLPSVAFWTGLLTRRAPVPFACDNKLTRNLGTYPALWGSAPEIPELCPSRKGPEEEGQRGHWVGWKSIIMIMGQARWLTP